MTCVVAIFSPVTDECVALFRVSTKEAMAHNLAMNSRYWGFEGRQLDGTDYEQTMTILALPTLTALDAAIGREKRFELPPAPPPVEPGSPQLDLFE